MTRSKYDYAQNSDPSEWSEQDVANYRSAYAGGSGRTNREQRSYDPRQRAENNQRTNSQQTSKKQGADYMRQGKKSIGKMFGLITPKRALVVFTTTALLVIAATPWVTIVHPPASSLVASSIIWGSFWGWVISVIEPIWFFGPKIAVVIEQLFIRNVAYFITCVLYVVLNLTEAGVIFKNSWIRVFAYAVDISILYMFSPFYGTSAADLFTEFPSLEWESLNVGLLLLFIANVFSFEICYQFSKSAFD